LGLDIALTSVTVTTCFSRYTYSSVDGTPFRKSELYIEIKNKTPFTRCLTELQERYRALPLDV